MVAQANGQANKSVRLANPRRVGILKTYHIKKKVQAARNGMDIKCFEFSFFFQIPGLFGTHPSLGATALAAVFISNCFISVIGVKISFFLPVKTVCIF